jgi:hypothetical protein
MREFVYITSASYSGSTLLTFLLNTHPKIATIGEMKGDSMDTSEYKCSCGCPIGACSFWSELVERLKQSGVHFDLADKWTQSGFRIRGGSFSNRVAEHRVRGPVLEAMRELYLWLSLRCRRDMVRICRTNEAFVESVAALSGKPIFLDSSKTPIRLKHLRRIPSLNIKVIHLTRDGRGVTNSSIKHHGWGAEIAAREWVNAQREIEHVLAYFRDDQVHRVHYEELCTDTDRTLHEMFRFIGVDPAEANTDFRVCTHHILGNQMRFRNSSEIRLDTKWTTGLSHEQMNVFKEIGGATNARYGYSQEALSGEPAVGTGT